MVIGLIRETTRVIERFQAGATANLSQPRDGRHSGGQLLAKEVGTGAVAAVVEPFMPMESQLMEVNSAQRLRCVDCGATDSERTISKHLGAASKPNDEGHVTVQQVPLCDECANRRLADQEEIPLFG